MEFLFDNGIEDHYVVNGNIGVHPAAAGLDLRDLVNDLHAGDDFAENAVTVVLRGRSAEIQKIIVHEVDEELAGRGVHDLSACHGDRAAFVGNLVLCLIDDGVVIFLLGERGIETAALDHKVRNDPVKKRILIKTGFDIIQKIFDCDRSFFIEQFQFDVSEIRFKSDHAVFSFHFCFRTGLFCA